MKGKGLLAVLGTLIIIALLAFFVLSGKTITIGGQAAKAPATTGTTTTAPVTTGTNTATPTAESTTPATPAATAPVTPTTNGTQTTTNTTETTVPVAPKPAAPIKEGTSNAQTAVVNTKEAVPASSTQSTTVEQNATTAAPTTTSAPAGFDATTNGPTATTEATTPAAGTATTATPATNDGASVTPATGNTTPATKEPIKISNPLSHQNISLGLDLKGGVSIVYQADKANPSQHEMESAVSLLRSRLDRKNYTEAEVSIQGTNRILVEIPGIGDPNKAVAEIGRTAELKFIGLTKEQLSSIQSEASAKADQLLGANADPLQKYQYVNMLVSQGIQSQGELILRGLDIANANMQFDNSQGKAEPVVGLELSAAGTQKFAAGTRKFIGNYIAIVLDQEIISMPRVSVEINTGKAVINGMGSQDEARNLAELINSGALPFKLNDIQRTAIEARLGQDAIDTSVMAGIIGFILVVLFMIFAFRFLGFVADIALTLYVLLVLSALSILNITLTLPGIAGIILTVGMAVDANVIIFSRIKEELGKEKTLGASITTGFHKAMSSIIDGNTCGFIIAIILYYQGTGPIKGFAQTLMIGILVSLFTAIFVSRFLINAFIDMGVKDPVLFGASKKQMKVADLSKK